MSLNFLDRLGRDVAVYGVGGVLAKAVGILLIPIYTRLFTPADYGQIELLAMTAALLGAVMNLGMDSAQTYFFFERKQSGREEQARVVSVIVRWRVVWGLVSVLFATALAPLLNALLFQDRLQPIHFVAAFCGVAFSQVLAQSVELYRLLYQPWRFVITTLVATCFAAAGALFCIVMLDMGIAGYFVGQAVGAAMVAGVNWWILRAWIVPIQEPVPLLRRMWKFGAPLLPGEIAFFLLGSADRWALSETRGDHELGIYSIAMRFAMLIALGIDTFRRAWWPVAMEAMHGTDGAVLYRTVARLYVGVAAAGIVLLSALSPWLVRTFTAPAFHEAHPLVGVLAWSSVLYGFFMIGGSGIWKTEKTWLTSLFMLAAGMVNIALAWWWSTLWGAMGAALALVASYAIWIALTLWASERLWRVGFPWRVLVPQVAGGASCGWLIYWLHARGENELVVWGVALAAAAVLLATALDDQQRESVWRTLCRSLSRS